MKKLLTLTLLLLAFSVVWGRKGEQLPTLRDYQAFLKSKTLVVLEKKVFSDFNQVIERAMNNSWHLTPYEVVEYDTFEKRRHDAGCFFLMVTRASFEKERTGAQYNFLSLLRGEGGRHITDLPDLCSIPLSYAATAEDEYTYKMEAFLRFIQSHVELMISSPALITENSLKYYNKNIAALNGKTLYLVKDELSRDVDTRKEIQKAYPWPFKIVSRQEVEEAIRRKKQDVVFLHKVGPGDAPGKARVFKILVGAANPVFYYFDHEMVKRASDDAFHAKDFKRLR